MKVSMNMIRKLGADVLCAALLNPCTAMAATVQQDYTIPMTDAGELPSEWKKDQGFVLADPAPWTLEELKSAVDVHDPRSVAAYYIWSLNRLTDSYDDGMAMMKYLYADIEPFDKGFTEGGVNGKAGWQAYFDERLRTRYYRWLPRAYFEGASPENGFVPARPLTLTLCYNDTNTETINAQTWKQLGRLNIVYWMRSHAGGNQVNITLSRFSGSDRWYVTSGATASAVFYDQNGVLKQDAAELVHSLPNDTSTAEDHIARYGTP